MGIGNVDSVGRGVDAHRDHVEELDKSGISRVDRILALCIQSLRHDDPMHSTMGLEDQELDIPGDRRGPQPGEMDIVKESD